MATDTSLSGIHKVAVLMALVGADMAARLLKQFESDEQAAITKAMLDLEDMEVDEESIRGTLEDFRTLLATGGSAIPNLEKTLVEVLNKAYGADETRRRLAEMKEEAKVTYPFRSLRGLRPHDLAKVLMAEHPQVQALVLAHLDPEQAGAVLDGFPEEERPALVVRMANLEEPSARLLKQVAADISERCRGLKRGEDRDPGAPDPRLETVAEILLNAPTGADKRILESLASHSEDLVSRIRERMFEWADLSTLDKRTMQRVLADVDTRLLALALKRCDDAVRDQILGSVSQRTAEMIKEERDLLGSVPLKEVIEAQGHILKGIRDLISKGEVTPRRGKESVYVA
jgi:flagellar motor switch protein FliG